MVKYGRKRRFTRRRSFGGKRRKIKSYGRRRFSRRRTSTKYLARRISAVARQARSFKKFMWSQAQKASGFSPEEYYAALKLSKAVAKFDYTAARSNYSEAHPERLGRFARRRQMRQEIRQMTRGGSAALQFLRQERQKIPVPGGFITVTGVDFGQAAGGAAGDGDAFGAGHGRAARAAAGMNMGVQGIYTPYAPLPAELFQTPGVEDLGSSPLR